MSYRDWILSKLNKKEDHHDEIEFASALGIYLIEIKTVNAKRLVVGVIDKDYITDLDASQLYDSEKEKPNLLIARSGAIWVGSAINYCGRHNIGWGGLGQISSTFQTTNYARIQKSEYAFVEDGLLRHSIVSSLDRIYDRVFKIHRKGNLSALTITLINSYELTGDEVRNAITKYGRFDAVLKTNPNGNPTGNAYSAAAEIDADIFVWRELWGRLNRK
jgi:hypothetical protein